MWPYPSKVKRDNPTYSTTPTSTRRRTPESTGNWSPPSTEGARHGEGEEASSLRLLGKSSLQHSAVQYHVYRHLGNMVTNKTNKKSMAFPCSMSFPRKSCHVRICKIGSSGRLVHFSGLLGPREKLPRRAGCSSTAIPFIFGVQSFIGACQGAPVTLVSSNFQPSSLRTRSKSVTSTCVCTV